MFCNQCGKNIQEDQSFCNHCGAKLKNVDSNLESNKDVTNHAQVEKSTNGTDTYFITSKKNLMILFSLIGYACMLLPFAKILGENQSSFEMLRLSEYAFGNMAIALLLFVIGSFYIARSKLRTAQVLYAIGTITVFAIMQNYVETILFSIEFGAWLIVISGALVVSSGVIAKQLCSNPSAEPFSLPPIVTKIWIVVCIIVLITLLTSTAGTAIFSNKVLPNQ